MKTVLVLLAIVLGGCATANTPQQVAANAAASAAVLQAISSVTMAANAVHPGTLPTALPPAAVGAINNAAVAITAAVGAVQLAQSGGAAPLTDLDTPTGKTLSPDPAPPTNLTIVKLPLVPRAVSLNPEDRAAVEGAWAKFLLCAGIPASQRPDLCYE